MVLEAGKKMKGSQGKSKLRKLSQHFTSKSDKALLKNFAHFCQEDQHNLLWDKEAQAQKFDQEREIQQQREIILILLDLARILT